MKSQLNINKICQLSLVLSLSLFSFLSRADLNDSVVIESEESLAKTYEAEFDHEEALKRHAEARQETEQLVTEARTNISNSKSQQLEYKKQQKKLEQDIKSMKSQVKNLKSQESRSNVLKNKFEKKVKALETQKENLANKLNSQKNKNETLLARIKDLKEQKKIVLQQIYKNKIQLAQQKKKFEKQKKSLNQLDHEMKQLIAKRNAKKRML